MSFFEKLKEYITEDLFKYLGETIEMVFVTVLIALVFGLLLGLVMFYTNKSKKKGIRILYKIIDVIVGILRSFPFYVLMFFVVPFTRVMMSIFTGKSQAFSTEAFTVPLTIAAIPFFAKLFENSLKETNNDILEVGEALGLNKFQITTKIILKEALPSIISGTTLAIITLIGYSAMAGAVGGGGLGFFAYDKGYVSYDFTMMCFAVITIIILVLLIQFLGNLLYKAAKKGHLSYLKIGIGILALLVIFITTKVTIYAVNKTDLTVIKVGTMSEPGEPIIESIQEKMEDLGYKVEIVIESEFDPLNQALEDGSVDVNLFQHEPYLNSYNELHDTDLYNACTMYDCVYGAYSYKIDGIDDLKGNSEKIIAVANDSSNLKRCLDLLAANGIIELTDYYETASSYSATDIDKYYTTIKDFNGVEIKPMSTASITQALNDENCYLGIVNATFAIQANLGSEELIFEEEDLEHVNANILACRLEDKDSLWLKDLVSVLTSDETSEFITKYFKGTIKPYFVPHI